MEFSQFYIFFPYFLSFCRFLLTIILHLSFPLSPQGFLLDLEYLQDAEGLFVTFYPADGGCSSIKTWATQLCKCLCTALKSCFPKLAPPDAWTGLVREVTQLRGTNQENPHRSYLQSIHCKIKENKLNKFQCVSASNGVISTWKHYSFDTKALQFLSESTSLVLQCF